MRKPNFHPVGIGPAHYVGPELGGTLTGRSCNTCVHLRKIPRYLMETEVPPDARLCIHPKIAKTRSLVQIEAWDEVFDVTRRMGLIDRRGCCDEWRPDNA